METTIRETKLTDGSLVYSVRLTEGSRLVILDCNDKNDAEVIQLHIAARVCDFSATI